jgi:GAF domain-containing protein/DNA-binding response OmpR family regulator
MIDRRTIHVEDVQADSATEYTWTRQNLNALGYRTVLATPMLSQGVAIGAIHVRRREVRAFTDKQIALLETFADQAVIAIENARLFNELQDRNRDLTEALDRQTVTAEVLEVISSAPTDLQLVLDLMIERASRLCQADEGGIIRVDGGTMVRAARFGQDRDELTALARTFALVRESIPGRAIIDRCTIHLPDVLAEEAADFALSQEINRRHGFRAVLAVPLLHQGSALGAILLRREAVGPFSAGQISLLETFANQAVIAIENARLFHELQARNQDLSESLEQQTVTAEVLRVISSAPTDLQRVMGMLAERVGRLCEATTTLIYSIDGDSSRLMARVGPEATHHVGHESPMQVIRGNASVEAVFQRRTIHVDDTEAASGAEFPATRMAGEWEGFRTIAATPLLRRGEPIGVISVRRAEARPFSPGQIALLETFADQAVIAIENARLFDELQDRNRELTEALEQQTVTSEVLRVISSAPTDLPRVLTAVVEAAARLCEAPDILLQRGSLDGVYSLAGTGPVGARLTKEFEGRPLFPVSRRSVSGRAMIDRETKHINDMALEIATEYSDARQLQDLFGTRTLLSVPLLRDEQALGALTAIRTEVRPFTVGQIRLLETFADQAVIAIENARLFNELQDRNQALTDALEQQTVTGEVLKVISSAPTDLHRVLSTVAEAAARLCDAEAVWIGRGTREGIVIEAGSGPNANVLMQALGPRPLLPLTRGAVNGRAYLDRQTQHIPDIVPLLDSEFPDARHPYELSSLAHSWHSVLSVPLLREGQAVGVISATRLGGVRPFSDAQIRLMEMFADQAAIAVENARLFDELQDRTQALTRSVEELQVLAEVSQAVSSTLDRQVVLDTIVARAVELAGADGGTIYEYNEASQEFELRVAYRTDAAIQAVVREHRVRLGETAVGQAATERRPVQIEDLADQPPEPIYQALVQAGYRSALIVPLLSDAAVLGALIIRRRVPGPFSGDTIRLLQTFATQSVLAIQNARLYQEIADQSRQLAVASQHKSEFLANMSHELRTPLNAVIGFSEVLLERMVGDVNERQEEYLQDILASGRHLLALINDILDLSKVEAGHMELEVSTVDLPQVLASGLTMVRERASRHSITLTQSIASEVGLIEADERKLKQVVFNLLSNAVKFTPDGGAVEISARVVGDAAEVAVRDTGIGIAPEDHEQVFEAFQQAGGAAPGTREGTGLGLPLARSYVELHGGRLWLTSAVGQGSTFTFTIPLAQREPLPTDQTVASSQPPAEQRHATGDGPMVLIVEDDSRAADLLSLYLVDAGFSVVVAGDGEAGLARAREQRPALIVLDVLLPTIDGWEVLARAKADPALAGIPVIVVSMVDERGKGFALGAADYLVKPARRETLIAAVRRLTQSPAAGGAATVVAIDDDPLALELVAAVLEPAGYRVLRATGGEAGLALIVRERPNLVILDLTMPEVDGFAVVERLRADPTTASLPVIVLTALAMTPAEKARLNGRVSHLARKGEFSRQEFEALVRRQLAPAGG